MAYNPAGGVGSGQPAIDPTTLALQEFTRLTQEATSARQAADDAKSAETTAGQTATTLAQKATALEAEVGQLTSQRDTALAAYALINNQLIAKRTELATAITAGTDTTALQAEIDALLPQESTLAQPLNTLNTSLSAKIKELDQANQNAALAATDTATAKTTAAQLEQAAQAAEAAAKAAGAAGPNPKPTPTPDDGKATQQSIVRRVVSAVGAGIDYIVPNYVRCHPTHSTVDDIADRMFNTSEAGRKADSYFRYIWVKSCLTPRFNAIVGMFAAGFGIAPHLAGFGVRTVLQIPRAVAYGIDSGSRFFGSNWKLVEYFPYASSISMHVKQAVRHLFAAFAFFFAIGFPITGLRAVSWLGDGSLVSQGPTGLQARLVARDLEILAKAAVEAEAAKAAAALKPKTA
jgi:hypothetical protein